MQYGNRGVVLTEDTEYAKEMRKHEATHTRYGAPGRPYTFSEYPKRLYRAAWKQGDGIQIVDAQTVQNDLEEANLRSRGFHFGQEVALREVELEQTEQAKLAAEREWEIRHGRLSERAVTEVRAHEEAYGARHLPAIPETPIARRGPGRPKKATEPAPVPQEA